MTLDFGLVLLVHAAATLFMTGVIWFVHVVHYPLFAGVGPELFPRYQAANTRRTGYVVMPPITALWSGRAAVVFLMLQRVLT